MSSVRYHGVWSPNWENTDQAHKPGAGNPFSIGDLVSTGSDSSSLDEDSSAAIACSSSFEKSVS